MEKYFKIVGDILLDPSDKSAIIAYVCCWYDPSPGPIFVFFIILKHNINF